jgi:hypothetical protein
MQSSYSLLLLVRYKVSYVPFLPHGLIISCFASQQCNNSHIFAYIFIIFCPLSLCPSDRESSLFVTPRQIIIIIFRMWGACRNAGMILYTRYCDLWIMTIVHQWDIQWSHKFPICFVFLSQFSRFIVVCDSVKGFPIKLCNEIIKNWHS